MCVGVLIPNEFKSKSRSKKTDAILKPAKHMIILYQISLIKK